MKSAASFSWDDEAVELLKKHAALGDSATTIAAVLGHGVTRNAVIGKCQRMKIDLGSGRTLKGAGSRNLEARLHARHEDGQRKVAYAGSPASRPLRRPAAAGNSLTALSRAAPALAEERVATFLATPARQRAFDPAQAPAGARFVKLEELERGDCRWPLFEDGPMVFCACRVTTFDKDGQPDVYCEPHLAMRNPRVTQ